MSEIITIAAVVLAALAAGLIIYAAIKPGTFRVERSVEIAASRDRIFPLINNLRAMNSWNSFVDPDPNIRLDYSGPESGRGAAYTWAGNRSVGEGRVEILDVVVPSNATMKLDMVKPMKAHHTVEFTLVPNGNGTKVTWAMSGGQPFIVRLVSVFVDCDRMVGSVLEKGLTRLKGLAEG